MVPLIESLGPLDKGYFAKCDAEGRPQGQLTDESPQLILMTQKQLGDSSRNLFIHTLVIVQLIDEAFL